MKKKIIKNALFWLMLSGRVGLIGAAIGVLFVKSVSFATSLRQENLWLIALLPILGVISVIIYKSARLGDIGTNCVFESVKNEKKVPILLGPAVFLATCLAHLGGASVGREGAALQIGGSLSSAISKLFHLDEQHRHTLSICSMAALFSAVFGTPLGACVFSIEVIRLGRSFIKVFFPALISSLVGYAVSLGLGLHPERFKLTEFSDYGIVTILKTVVIAVTAAAISIIFCGSLKLSHKLFKKILKNEYLRIAVGGVIIVVLTYLVGNTDFNGSGIEIIGNVFDGNGVANEVFLIKILFTVISIGCGFKGGEIIPTLFIGTTLGAAVAAALGLPLDFGASIGMSALFAGVTNCPVATVFLCAELFGGVGILWIILASALGFLLSGNISLYTSEKFSLLKLK